MTATMGIKIDVIGSNYKQEHTMNFEGHGRR